MDEKTYDAVKQSYGWKTTAFFHGNFKTNDWITCFYSWKKFYKLSIIIIINNNKIIRLGERVKIVFELYYEIVIFTIYDWLRNFLF